MPPEVRTVRRPHRRELRTVGLHGDVHGRRRRQPPRRRYRNPVLLTRSVQDGSTKVTLGGAPAMLWPGGGITVMGRRHATARRTPSAMCADAALVAPIEFTMRARFYSTNGSAATWTRSCRSRGRSALSAARRGASRCRPPALAAGGRREVTWAAAQAALLPDGRLHLQHGPIDLVIGAEGDPAQVKAAGGRGVAPRFVTVLGRTDRRARPAAPASRRRDAADAPLSGSRAAWWRPAGRTAAPSSRRWQPWRARLRTRSPRRCWLRRLICARSTSITAATSPSMRRRERRSASGWSRTSAPPRPEGVIAIGHASGIGGVATSGWRGRPVLLARRRRPPYRARAGRRLGRCGRHDHRQRGGRRSSRGPRAPARSLDPDSDLGDRLVTTDVGPLPDETGLSALRHGGLRPSA